MCRRLAAPLLYPPPPLAVLTSLPSLADPLPTEVAVEIRNAGTTTCEGSLRMRRGEALGAVLPPIHDDACDALDMTNQDACVASSEGGGGGKEKRERRMRNDGR